MPIEILFWDIDEYLVGDDVQKYIEKKFNCEFVPRAVDYANYVQQTQKIMVSTDIPDVIVSDIWGSATFDSWVSQNYIRPLPKDLSRYPNLKSYLNKSYNLQFKDSDGNLYMIPRITYSDESFWALDRCLIVRQDWLDALDLEMPQSSEEFEQMLHAFVYDDPDGNGIDDTGGLVATHPNTLEALYLNIFPPLSNTERGWLFEDNQWMPVYCSKRVPEALSYLQNLYQQGLLQKDFAYVTRSEAIENFFEGKTGVIAGQYQFIVNYMASIGRQEECSLLYKIIPPWNAPDGKKYRFTTPLHWSETYFTSEVDDEKMHRILSLYDWLLSDEYMRLSSSGLNEDDTEIPVLKYPSVSFFNYLVYWKQDSQYEDTVDNQRLYGKLTLEYENKMLKWFSENTNRVDYNFNITFMSTPAKNALISNAFVQKEMTKIIIGQEDVKSQWAEVIERLRKETTLEQAIKEVTEKANGL